MPYYLDQQLKYIAPKMTTQAQNATDHLMNEIRQYASRHQPISDFTLAKFRRDADKIKRVSRAENALLLGIIACLAGDVEECKKQHELSIKLGVGDVFFINYGYSLLFMDRFFDAYQCTEKGLGHFPASLELLTLGIETSFMVGAYDKMVNYVETLNKIKPYLKDEKIDQRVKDAKQALNMGLSAGTLQKLLEKAEFIRLKYAVKFLSVLLKYHESSLFQWIETSADADLTAKMNIELCSDMADDANQSWNTICVAFRACQP